MEPIPLTISVALVLISIGLVSYPLWRQGRKTGSGSRAQAQSVEEHQARYGAVLAAIRELMFDHEMGKLADDDYQTLLARAKLNAARIQQELTDAINQKTEPDPALAATIDALVREQRRNGADEALQVDVQREIERLKQIPVDEESGAPLCPHCGSAIEIGDLFCTACGRSLQSPLTKDESDMSIEPAVNKQAVLARALLFLLLTGLLLALPAKAQAAPPPQAPAPDEPPSITNGRIIWDGACQSCHGLTGQGDGPDAADLAFPPADFTDPETARGLVPTEAFDVIKNGRLDKEMPAWEDDLTDASIWNTVAYIWALGVSPEKLSAGETVYLETCAVCHGERGAGDGPDAPADMPDLTDQEAMLQQSQADLMAKYAASEQHADLDQLDEENVWRALDYTRTFVFPVPTRDGVQTGQVINVTSGAPQGDVQVLLHMLQGESEELFTLATFADEEGRYTFDRLPVDPAFRYIVEVIYEGIGYLGEATTILSAEAPTSTVDVKVYATTGDDDALYIDQMQLLLTFTPKMVSVMHAYIVGNDGDATYIGQDGRTFAFQLPAGATDVVFQNDMNGQRFVQIDGGYADTEPVMPSEKGLAIYGLYDIPVTEGALTIELPFPVDAKSVDVLVNEQGVILESDQVTPTETVEFRGSTFVRLHGEDFVAGDVLKLALSELEAVEPVVQEEAAAGGGLPSGDFLGDLMENGLDQTAWRWVILALGGLVLVAGVLLYPATRARRPSPAVPAENDLETRRQKLLLLLAELDDAREAGEIDPAVYEEARAQYRAELAEIMDQI